MRPELDERASILVAWIAQNPDLVLRREVLEKGLRLELEAAYRLGLRVADADISG